ncbi:hypothetical protein VARIO8X_60314 [Burkholderiales bacterium 8X]|nr:hypothetical protein VARIO8X_60314 [Burkholderiales bacterium 8X]
MIMGAKLLQRRALPNDSHHRCAGFHEALSLPLAIDG